jgi:prepilin-type N-terminal cleavage/methylation domain-containing protein
MERPVTRHRAPALVSAALRRLRQQRGLTLIELVTTMSILLIVISGIATLFVSGNNAENELNLRFVAQTEARLALDTFRREVHNACSATVTGGTQITLKTIAQPVPGAGNLPCNVTSATWCSAGSGSNFGLYRQSGASCSASTGTQRASYLVSGAIFSLPATPAGQLPKVTIDMTVNRQPSITRLNYRLTDDIALRSARRV